MPNWSEVLSEIQQEAQKNKINPLDVVRRKYLAKISELTGRNTIAYYSGWLQKGNHNSISINDIDKQAFMLCIHKLDRTKGLDLMLHTPGGDLAATESLVDYLKLMFGNNIRAIIPQISMSAGTMIALSCKEVMMGKQSNLGPIDPQIGGVPCQAVLDEFDTAKADIAKNPRSAPLWQTIISKYHPTFLGTCKQAIEWSEKLGADWLKSNMCQDDVSKVQKILDEFCDHRVQKSHSRHISILRCKDVGVKVVDMEESDELQDAILTTHHAFMHTFSISNAIKIVENQDGIAYVEGLPAQTPQKP